jgi:hypothetical protein
MYAVLKISSEISADREKAGNRKKVLAAINFYIKVR